jgi:hypothetical protein
VPPSPPNPGQLQAFLNAPLIGPQAYWLMDMGLVLSTLSDFAVRSEDGSFRFVSARDVTTFSTEGPSQAITASIRQHKGRELLSRLRWLAEVLVLQQALIYGDLTANLAERTLYDAGTRSLNVDTSKCGTGVDCQQKQFAILAMKANPTLARNVVMLALRHAIEDALGGVDKAEALQYRQTYYRLALADFAGPQACDKDPIARKKLNDLFPNWQFEYRATSAQRQNGYGACPAEVVADLSNPTAPPAAGNGPAINLGEFYVVVPSAPVLAKGMFEQSDSLKLVSAYRDRISQACIDRDVGVMLKSIVAGGGDVFRRTAFGLVNDAWGWQPLKPANP